MSNRSIAIAVALIMSAGMWGYVVRVANPNISRQAALAGDQAGILGDLYPSWYGTRQLALHGQNPYSQRVSEDLQVAYYGNLLSDGSRNEQRFAYPVFVALFLLPTVNLNFGQVQIIASFVMAGAIAISVPCWLGFIGWTLPRWKVTVIVLLVLSCSPSVQALEMQQLSTLVCAFIAAGALLLRRRAYVASGLFFGLATIKPQMVFLLYLWLLLWTLSKWRERKKLLLSFSIVVAALILAGQWMVPGWVGQFMSAIAAYRRYAGDSAQSIVEMSFGRPLGMVVSFAVLCGLAIACLRWRMEPAESPKFSLAVALVLAISTVLVPPAAPYNHLLLLPGVLILVRSWSDLWNSGKIVAGVSLLATAAILWPWIAAIGILLISFGSPVRQWALPFYASLVVPLSVAALLILQPARSFEVGAKEVVS
jgi:Glycosyltransferase family 87